MVEGLEEPCLPREFRSRSYFIVYLSFFLVLQFELRVELFRLLPQQSHLDQPLFLPFDFLPRRLLDRAVLEYGFLYVQIEL
jgi:hypothetical protein